MSATCYQVAAMMNSVSLLAVAALVVLQYGVMSSGQLLENTNKMDIDNNLRPNEVPGDNERRVNKFIRFVSAPQPRVRFDGTPLILSCDVIAVPAPSIRWLKNNEPAEEFDEETNEIPPFHPTDLGRMSSTLIVTSASNGDVFSCEVTAGLKQDSASTTVMVDEESNEPEQLLIEKLFAMPSKPLITKMYLELFQNIGTRVILPCRVFSTTKAQVYWLDTTGKVIYGDSRLKVLPSGHLYILSLRFSDMGNFKCVVKNMYGTASENTFMYPMKVK